MKTYMIRYWSYQGNHAEGKNQERKGDQSTELMSALKIENDPDEQIAIYGMEKGNMHNINGNRIECTSSRIFDKTDFGHEVEMKFLVS